MIPGRDLYAVWRSTVVSAEERRPGADPERVSDDRPEWMYLRASERAAWGVLGAMLGDWIEGLGGG